MDLTIAPGPEKYDLVVLYVDWWWLGQEIGGIDHERVGVKNTLVESGDIFSFTQERWKGLSRL